MMQRTLMPKPNPYQNDWTEYFMETARDFLGQENQGVALFVFSIAAILIIWALIDYALKSGLLYLTQKVTKRTKFKWDNVFYSKKVFNSIYHLISLGITQQLIPYLLYPSPKYFSQMEKGVQIAFVLILLQLFFRLADALLVISTDENNYRTIAVRTFGQLMKIISIFFAVLIVISILFNVELQSILAGLGAATAILLLIFRDSILGFVSGVQIASTKMVKVGDWVSIPKYNLEGVVLEINLISTKLENFDKTISSIPTQELIATEVKNYESMRETQTRRIKRSILFNIKSFKFCNDDLLAKFAQIPLLNEYIKIAKETQPEAELTNIGVFRKYTELYLQSLDTISPFDILMVRQLEITPQGMPLEIYCFTNTTDWQEFESIQSDIFDHLLTKAKEFDLEVTQTLTA